MLHVYAMHHAGAVVDAARAQFATDDDSRHGAKCMLLPCCTVS